MTAFGTRRAAESLARSRLGVYATVISPAVVHSGGIDLPGSPYDDGEPTLPSAASPTSTTFIFGTPTVPGTTTNAFTSLSNQAAPAW